MTEDHNIPPSNRIIAPFSLEEMPLEWLRNAQANAKLGQIKAVTPGVRLALRGSVENDLSIAYFANGVNHAFSLRMLDGRPQLHFHTENGKTIFDGNKSEPILESSLQACCSDDRNPPGQYSACWTRCISTSVV